MSINEEQERINEEIYEEEYLGRKKQIMLGDCPECLDSVFENQDHAILILSRILKNGTEYQNHTEFYHLDCSKRMEKRKNGQQ